MSDKDVLAMHIAMVPFWAEVCGPACEIVVHDITDPDRSIVALENVSTGRRLGDSLTDLARDIVKDGHYKTHGYMSGYAGNTKEKEYLSYTYYIKNEGRLIGLLCINKDLSVPQSFQQELHALMEKFSLAPPEKRDTKETLDSSVSGILHNLVAGAIGATGIPPTRMSMEEKVQVVHALNEQGVLLMKGSVAEIAAQLNISEPTVYRYLNRRVG